jgi:hypothetical protein
MECVSFIGSQVKRATGLESTSSCPSATPPPGSAATNMCRRRGRHCRLLFGGRYFRCRQCHGLEYASRNMSPAQRAMHRADRIANRLHDMCETTEPGAGVIAGTLATLLAVGQACRAPSWVIVPLAWLLPFLSGMSRMPRRRKHAGTLHDETPTDCGCTAMQPGGARGSGLCDHGGIARLPGPRPDQWPVHGRRARRGRHKLSAHRRGSALRCRRLPGQQGRLHNGGRRDRTRHPQVRFRTVVADNATQPAP